MALATIWSAVLPLARSRTVFSLVPSSRSPAVWGTVLVPWNPALSFLPAGGDTLPEGHGIDRPETMPTSAFTDEYVSWPGASPAGQLGPPWIGARARDRT